MLTQANKEKMQKKKKKPTTTPPPTSEVFKISIKTMRHHLPTTGLVKSKYHCQELKELGTL